jgi:phosphatidylserine/phosphatidylglycerophosphate/cardiolipin synthase-like enzyme/uncharacterized membrane protein YdjX (TVP38/TMEM64 family)
MSDAAAMQKNGERSGSPILQVGRNCWRRVNATRAGVLIDTADYFAAFAEACRAAQRQILILGWDFDRRECLHRDQGPRDLPDQLGAFLVELVRRNRHLNVYLLSWDFNMVYAVERELLPALRLRLQAPPRFHFRLDGSHPKGASHHQKLVVVDDHVAFVGGIDLSRWRWDTCEHLPDDPRRIDPNGKPYPPFHDMMMLVEGEAAATLGDLARERWRRAKGWKVRPPRGIHGSPWPPGVEAGLHDVQVGIARTEPTYAGRAQVREVERLYLDAVAAARHSVYIENQYFTSRRLGETLAARLADAEGPEVVLVLPERTGGWLEQVTMDVIRGRVLERLVQADRHHRLRVYFPYQPGLGDDCISVHAKLLIVDDCLLRIGSSNTSNRSMGLDTECDLAIESRSPDDRVAQFIHGLRSRLLAEHLGCNPAEVDTALRDQPVLIEAIESLRQDGRSLRLLDWQVLPEIDQRVPDDGVIDPTEPFSPGYFVSEYVPKPARPAGRRRLLAFAALVATLLALAAAWRWTPLSSLLDPQRISEFLQSLGSSRAEAVVAVGGFAVAALAMVPVTLLAAIVGVAFGGWQAFAYVLSGATLACAIGFALGRLLGRRQLERFEGSRIEQLSKRLAQRGTVAVAVLRLLPVAPFAVFNLVAGSSHLGARQFMVGSLIGLAPGMLAITLFSRSLWDALAAPTWENGLFAAGLGLALLVAAWMAKRWLRSG